MSIDVVPHSSRSSVGGRRSRLVIALTLLACIALRIHVFSSLGPILSPDSLSYLNVARQFRGVSTPSDWDPVAMMPRNDQGARPPAYPLLLAAVFAVTPGGTAPRWLERFVRDEVIDDWHRRFLSTAENIRAVQVAQHALGVVACYLALTILLRWTNRRTLSAAGALVAVGIRPAWFLQLEPWILSEVLGATCLLAWLAALVEIEQTHRRSVGPVIAGSILTGIAVLTRPAYMFLPVMFFVALWLGEPKPSRKIMVRAVLPLVLLLSAWVMRNEVTYGFAGISSTLGINTVSHFRGEPEVFSDPRVRSLILKYRNEPYAGAWVAMDLVKEQGLTYPEASSLLARQTVVAATRDPMRLIRGYGRGVFDSLVPSDWREPSTAPVRASWNAPWRILFWVCLALQILGITACMHPALAVRVAAYTAVTSTLVTPLLTAIDNSRYSFAAQGLLAMCGIAALAAAMDQWSRQRQVKFAAPPSMMDASATGETSGEIHTQGDEPDENS